MDPLIKNSPADNDGDLSSFNLETPSASRSRRLSTIGRSFNSKSSYDNCYNHNESWEVQLGAGEIVNGLEKIILEMSVRDEVIAFIPSHLAYNNEGSGKQLLPAADLVVQVNLRGILSM